MSSSPLSSSPSGQSPLQLIYDAELAALRQLEEVRNQTRTAIATARHDAQSTIADAIRRGKTDAEVQFQAGIHRAQQDADAIIAAAHTQSSIPSTQMQARMDKSVNQIVLLVL